MALKEGNPIRRRGKAFGGHIYHPTERLVHNYELRESMGERAVHDTGPDQVELPNIGELLYRWGSNHSFMPSSRPQNLGWRFPQLAQ